MKKYFRKYTKMVSVPEACMALLSYLVLVQSEPVTNKHISQNCDTLRSSNLYN